MSVILVPKHGTQLQVNGWNWRPTVEILRQADLIQDEQYERLSSGACGGSVDESSAKAFAEYLKQYLQDKAPGMRVRFDDSATSEVKTGRLDADLNDLYSATFEWLDKFRDFCAECGGFQVV